MWMFNAYLLEGDDNHTVVVDPGLPSTAQMSIELIHRLGRDTTELHCLATHGHTDHVGGLPLMRQKMSSTTHLPGMCEEYLEGKDPRAFGNDAAIRFLPVFGQQPFSFRALREFVQGSRKIGFGGQSDSFQFPYQPEGFLRPGDRVPGANQWEVIETPGHADEALCFFHADSGTLLSGDAVVTLDGKAWFNPEWVDETACRQTEERLRALDVRYLLPGHGLPIEGKVWAGALSFKDKPQGGGVLARCSRRFGRWDRP